MRRERREDLVAARREVRRRGWWLILFGGLHALVFAGDIIGLYGVVAVVFAGWIAKHRTRWMTVIGVLIALGLIGTEALMPLTAADLHGGAGSDIPDFGLAWPLGNLSIWAAAAVAGGLLSMVSPAAFIGAALARTTLLTDPDSHRRLLTSVAVGGLGVGFLAALPYALVVAGVSAELWQGAAALNAAGSLLSAAG